MLLADPQTLVTQTFLEYFNLLIQDLSTRRQYDPQQAVSDVRISIASHRVIFIPVPANDLLRRESFCPSSRVQRVEEQRSASEPESMRAPVA